MYELNLTGAQKSRLRSLGQKTEPSLKLGKSGLGAPFYAELQRLLNANELVKVRFLDVGRDDRDALYATIADEGRCLCVGAVGHTALFYRQNPDPLKRKVALGD
jgi:RNA-binding protein